MRIQMKTLAAGPNGVRIPGKTYDVAEDEGRGLVDGGAAVALAARPQAAGAAADQVETADAPTPAEVETATSRTAAAPAGRGRRTAG